ncbi:MAG: ATPase, T2SS/T4P/T4SS family [Candidatus Saccharibacteria bacterium]|nr:ATPase, T2SS/T4P/T4SS family [Candidatus Saccharibacteria bacterium]
MRLLSQKKDQILDTLKSDNLLSATQIKKALNQSKSAGTDIFDYLIKQKLVDEEALTRIVAQTSNLPYVNLTSTEIHPKTLDLISEKLAKEYQAVAVGESNGKLLVAMYEAGDIQKVDFLTKLLGRDLDIHLASKTSIRNVLGQYEVKIKTQEIIKKLENSERDAQKLKAKQNQPKPSFLSPLKRTKNEIEVSETMAEESPASKALTNILQYAVGAKASDIHIESQEFDVRVRIRIDGVLVPITKFPKALEAGLIARVKICAQLKVDEKRLPQDGEFVINVNGKNIDLRVAVSPTVWGEQVIMRILDRTGVMSGRLENLGYCGKSLQVIREALKQSSGMILTSGPTGSGKTTSLYTLLQEILSDSVKIITLEDPAEYKLAGVNQIQVNPSIGLTFASGLKSILRQDPDVIMVGEIRDAETAQLAIQASLTGHLVFSTLHTNSVAGILPRLLDMGIEPFLIASTIRVVIGQRLLRKNTDEQEEYQSNPIETESIKQTLSGVLASKNVSGEELTALHKLLGYNTLPSIDDNAYTLYRGIDRHDANNGYKGRVGIYEAFAVTEAIQDLIIKRAPSSAIQEIAQKEGMITMRQDGYLKALAGLTTISEVDRVISHNSV